MKVEETQAIDLAILHGPLLAALELLAASKGFGWPRSGKPTGLSAQVASDSGVNHRALRLRGITCVGGAAY